VTIATIALTIEHGPHKGLVRGEILRRLQAMIRLLQLHKMEISFVLTTDERVHQLNKFYRKKDRPTDVLSFAMHEGEFGTLAGGLLGDVIVSVPTARRQAETRGAHVLDEVTMLFAHGLLHPLGWDHDSAAKDRRMRAETARLCTAAEAATGSRRKTKTPSKASAKAGEPGVPSHEFSGRRMLARHKKLDRTTRNGPVLT
jgi:probable rRNA maturation factor